MKETARFKRTPRYWEILLGAWLFISAFAWQHTTEQFNNAWLTGVLCVAFAMIGLVYGPARYLNTALAVWLFVSAFVLPTTGAATTWNNVGVGIAVFLASLVPHEGEPTRPAAARARPTASEHEIRP